ncbi:SDR family oxidoreductase [Psychromonas sp. KJ10-10]|uniref:SDR family oxidoreductase n=1 Tax=Psychromonas sp. KJ10-10 TaxID=3391823 RepID=UPI0039B36DDE
MTLKNKNIMVTGATSGIGKLLTETLLAEGANVAFCGRNEVKMSKLLTEFPATNSKIYYQTFDATNYQSVSNFIDNAIHKIGDIDVLVNCAGANSSRNKVSDISIDELQNMLSINMMSPFVFMKDVYQKSMSSKQQGKIINVLSTVCNYSNEGIGAYTASKAGFDALTKVFRKEVREQNIKICSLYPGGVDTPFRDVERPQYLQPQSVVEAILYILNQEANICVDELVIRPLIEKNYA